MVGNSVVGMGMMLQGAECYRRVRNANVGYAIDLLYFGEGCCRVGYSSVG